LCDPISLTGLALSGAAAAANGMAASKVSKARGEVMAAERARQGKLDQEAQALNVQSQDRYQGYEGKQDERSKALGEYFQQQRTAPDAPGAMTEGDITAPTSASNITVREEAKQRGKAAASTDAQGAALGQLRGFGDMLGETSRLQARDAGLIGQIGGFKKGSSDVTALELDAANGAGNGLKSLGSLLGLAGTAATGYGLQGSFANAATGLGGNTIAAARVLDRASVPNYATGGGNSLFGGLLKWGSS